MENVSIQKWSEGKISFIRLFVPIAFVTLGIVSNVVSGRLIAGPFGTSLPGAFVIFAMCLVVDDVNSFIFGYEKAKSCTWILFIMNVFMSLTYFILNALPHPVWFDPTPYTTVFTQSTWAVIASLTALLFSSFVNSYVLAKIKILINKKGGNSLSKKNVFLACYGSSIPAQFLDSFLYCVIAFFLSGAMGIQAVLAMAFAQWIAKLVAELVCQPLIAVFIPWFSKKTGICANEESTDFNPFRIQAAEA